MGTLIAWRYPTTLFLKLADHTYVTCGNGAVRWSCWGGSTGGTALRQGSGSTKRADAIAEPNARAGITCYLINGVCHQAANRILFPAGITVRGARGYYVSEALYGTYGRPRGVLGLICRAPFHQHPNVTGELAPCEAKAAAFSAEEATAAGDVPPERADPAFARYLDQVTALYSETDIRTLAEQPEQSRGFQMRLFGLLVDYRLTPDFAGSDRGRRLMEVRATTEDARIQLEDAHGMEEMPTDEFVTSYNHLIETFQHHVADVLSPDDYRRFLDLEPGDTLILGDPRIARDAYGGG